MSKVQTTAVQEPPAFSAADVLLLAQRIEKDGAAFYRSAAGQIKRAEVASMLIDLADIEDGHLAIFGDLLEEIKGRGEAAGILNPEDPTAPFLDAIARELFDHLSVPSARKLSKDATVADVLQTAIGLEKDSIIFYLGIKDAVPEKWGRSEIDGIIKEEMRHVGILSQGLKALGESSKP